MSPSLGKPILTPSSTAAPVWKHNNEQHKQGSQHKHTTQRQVPQATVMVWSAAALLGWTLSSSGLILLNKQLMVTDGFKHPMALTAAGQFTSYLGGNIIAVCRLQSRRTSCIICLIITSSPPPTNAVFKVVAGVRMMLPMPHIGLDIRSIQ
jgi:hypothetical protein